MHAIVPLLEQSAAGVPVTGDVFVEHVELVRVAFCLVWCLLADRQSLPHFWEVDQAVR